MAVVTPKRQKQEPLFEGNLLGQTPDFRSYCHTKVEYQEIGLSIVKTEIIGKPGWQSLHITPVL